VPKTKAKKPPKMPSIDLSSTREWVDFNWSLWPLDFDALAEPTPWIIRNLQFGVGNSNEWPMPCEYTITGGVIVRRLDTGERIAEPIGYFHGLFPKLVYHDDFFGCVARASVRCSVSPGSAR